MILAMLIKSGTSFQDQWYEQTRTLHHNMNMEPYPSLSFLFFLFLLLIDQPSNCQQEYLANQQLDCYRNQTASISRGYLCSGPRMSCQAFLTFIALPPYTSPINIAYLLGSEAASITLANNVLSPNDIVPTGKLVIVPISCSCSGSIYQHSALYTIKDRNETYFTIANNTYQGLSTCQALMGQNYYGDEDLRAGAQVTVPLRCACPSNKQTANGVTSLLAYMVTWGDSVSSIASLFGVDESSILEANRLSEDGIIFPFTPLLIPLRSESCLTNPENFFCHCPDGHLADGESGLQCTPNRKRFPLRLVILLGIGIAFGLLCVFFFFYKLYESLKRRRNGILKEKMFEKNGGLLLQQRLSSHGGSERAKLFTAEDLERATDNYNPNRFLGQGGYGTVFKGMLPDGSIVAVKRSKTIDRSQIEQFINEVVILSQINHRNIVRLLGCCLETDFPLLVYEFISNGNLSHHIHEQDQESSLPWVDRFRIAGEVAGAVAYMHSAVSSPIFHRDIKSSNILLDDNYGAKVSDFGTSRSVPSDRTHLTTVVQGTFGYLDPEYFHTSQFTDKSDVYSFGVVLAELLTGEKPISFARAEEGKNLAVHFISSVKENRLFDILDPRVAREARREDIQAIAELAMRCLRLNGKKRPTMKNVSMGLDGLRKSQSSLQIDIEPELLNDEVSFRRTGSQPGDLCTDNDISFSIELQPASI